MRQPDLYTPDGLRYWGVVKKKGERWVAARPSGHNAFSFRWRFKMAWLVLTGKCDVLQWED